MTHPLLTLLCLLTAFSTSQVLASGSVELVVRSSRTVIIEPTVCPNFECPDPDDLTPARKVQAGVPLRFQSTLYHGETRERIDVHVKIIEPDTNEIIATEHFKPPADTEWNPEGSISVLTSRGFNVSIELRNVCSLNYYGKRCGRFCFASKDSHRECSPEGERRCAAGWTDVGCSIPVCTGGCNGRGRCVAPGRCECAVGFRGEQCEQCEPRHGCVHGDCFNGAPNTCTCRPGFFGANCEHDLNICSQKRPCRNGGTCQLDASTSSGYKCECPVGVFGAHCESRQTSVQPEQKHDKCPPHAEHVCQNGGKCFVSSSMNVQCRCPAGFSGQFCEIGRIRDECGSKHCGDDATCQMIAARPVCVLLPKVTLTNGQEEMEHNMLYIGCILLCCVGICVASRVIYKRFIANQRELSAQASMSPVYKVCVIDADNNLHAVSPDAELEVCPHRHSPPPAYTSPVIPRLYKSVPTHEEPPFRDSVV